MQIVKKNILSWLKGPKKKKRIYPVMSFYLQHYFSTYQSCLKKCWLNGWLPLQVEVFWGLALSSPARVCGFWLHLGCLCYSQSITQRFRVAAWPSCVLLSLGPHRGFSRHEQRIWNPSPRGLLSFCQELWVETTPHSRVRFPGRSWNCPSVCMGISAPCCPRPAPCHQPEGVQDQVLSSSSAHISGHSDLLNQCTQYFKIIFQGCGNSTKLGIAYSSE